MIGLSARTPWRALLGRLYFLAAGLAFLLAHGIAMSQEGQESSPYHFDLVFCG
jgi:hypothetical protein